VKAVPDLIRSFVPRPFVTLGTDGYGRSDTRERLRRHFEIDRHHIVLAAVKALADDGRMSTADVGVVIRRLRLDPDGPDPCDL
jgi:pyruvate dehydrogenase E1 component